MIRSRWSDRIWIPIQVLAIMAAFLTPLWLQQDLDRAAPQLMSEVLDGQERTMISSRVLPLPEPLGRPQTLKFDIETRQFRFQRPTPYNRARLPASTADRSWRLTQISRRLEGGDWEEVHLVSNDGKHFLGSVFLEMEKDAEEFRVTFEQPGSRKKMSYDVKVRYAQRS